MKKEHAPVEKTPTERILKKVVQEIFSMSFLIRLVLFTFVFMVTWYLV